MQSLSKQTKKNLYLLFSIFAVILSFGHFLIIKYSIILAKQIDDANNQQPNVIPQWNAKQNIPFALIIGILAFIQFCSSLVFVFNEKIDSPSHLYYFSLMGFLSAFAIGVNLTILASEYNTFTRRYNKSDNSTPTLMTFYWALKLDSTATFLFAIPFLLFIHYNHLQNYLQEQRLANKDVTIDNLMPKMKKILVLFLFNSFAHAAFIWNVYQFTTIQDEQDYALDNLADQYTFYIAIQVIVTIIAIIIQIRHFTSEILKKKQLILIATLTAAFHLASFVIITIKALQFQIDISLINGGDCYFKDCDELSTFRWQLIGYSTLALLAIIYQIPYFYGIGRLKEKEHSRDMLLLEYSSHPS